MAQAQGYSVVLCNSDESEDKERRYIDVALQERVAGVILSPTGATCNVERLRKRGTPVVAVDRPLPHGDQVLVDTRLAARKAAEHLLAAGYRRVGCVTGPEGVFTADDRLAGYRDAMAAAGGRERFRHAEYRAAGGRRATAELLAEPEPPDALLIANSAMAIGALEALRDAKLRPGRDVGVVAFDEAQWATLVDPPLTVVAQPAYDMGKQAAKLLLARIGSNGSASSTITLAARLIERGSTVRGG
jgi:LacI family transcriptional regulator, galactose operon repressor